MNDELINVRHMQETSEVDNKNTSNYTNKALPPYGEVLTLINNRLEDCPDVVKRKVIFKGGKEGVFVYVQGLVNKELLLEHFINPLLFNEYENLKDRVHLESMGISMIKYFYDANEIVEEVMSGSTVLVVDGLNFAISTRVSHTEKRSISEPISEKNVKGPHEGFIEDIETNISLLRKKIKNSNLKFKVLQLGETTHQTVVIGYIQGIANNEILNTLYSKIQGINFDGLIDTGYLTQVITDFPNSVIPQYHATERVDKAIAALLEGRFIVMVDGTPTTVIAPVSYISFFQATDDYSSNWIAGSFLRTIRVVAMIIAVILPALYIALASFHPYMIPLDLLLPMAKSRARVPIPPVLEALIMEITIELLREASTRLPTYIGSTIGVVGGIVIGQAAVSAALVSDVLIVTVAITAIAAYVIPSYDMGLSIRVVRFAFMILAGIFGIIGIAVGFVLLIVHLMVIESLGQPFLQPIVPLKKKELKDVFLRFPIKYLKKRPDTAKPSDKERGKNNDKS